MCTEEAHSTLHPQGLLVLLAACNKPTLRPDCRQERAGLADALLSWGEAQPAERPMDLLYTVHRTIDLGNHADNYSAKNVQPTNFPDLCRLYSPFGSFLSILLVSLCWSILSSLIQSSPRLSWAPTFGLAKPTPYPFFPGTLLSPSDPPNWILWRQDWLILVCPVLTQSLPATW